jgi:hypothetical protein
MAVISFDATTISETPIDSSGAFSANFTIPVCESGAHTITVTDSMNTLQLTIHVEYQKIPQVSLVTPDKLGISGADVTLSWNGLQGFSDAVYTIQIARDDSFSPEALVLQETGIRNTFYQYYSDASVLSEIVLTPFYWRIRAESAMTVPGEWSEAREFLMILPPVSVNQAGSTNPLLQYGLFIEMGALGLLVVFWILRKNTKSAKKVRASQKA